MSVAADQISLPIDVAFDDGGFLGPIGCTAKFGCVVVATTPDAHVILIQKAPRPGYEFSGQWAFPGGMLRRKVSGTNQLSAEETLRASALSRFNAETGLQLSADDLQIGRWSPVATKYTVKGAEKTTIVLQAEHQFDSRPDKDRMVPGDSSISDVRLWAPFEAIPVCAPANRVILARRFWDRFDNSERAAVLPVVEEALDFCNSAALQCGLPQIRKWF